MCFASMAGCKTKPPKVAHPYVKEYVASYKTGSVNVKDFLDHGEEFAIGADENGKAVFKDPQKAFEALVRDYSDGINLIRDEYKLGPITPRNLMAGSIIPVLRLKVALRLNLLKSFTSRLSSILPSS